MTTIVKPSAARSAPKHKSANREEGVKRTPAEGNVVPKRKVSDLIAAITPENVHNELDTGEPIGSEFR
jgi:hypothetical protein